MKPFHSIDQQIEKLRANGLIVDESPETRRFLEDHNYYRLSGYFRYFQQNPQAGENQFESGTDLAKVRTVYEFDLQLAALLRAGLAEFEVVFRSRLAYLMAKSSGPTGYLYEENYENPNGTTRDKLLKDIQDDMNRSEERFAKHHAQRGESMPIWAAVEVMSLGTTSRMYGLVADVDGVYKPMAEGFGLTTRYSRKVFRSITVLRNVCSHHGRIWNRMGIELDTPPPARGKGDNKVIHVNTPWAWCVTLVYLVGQIRGNGSFYDEFWDFIEPQADWLVQGLTGVSPK
ncbi:Abi family protein [Mycolicibacterium sp. 120266]|uniref:Abi family protein n=1 Tax=Mycolicibacterium sp. 120266 TaxID=3090601 RepID=UPI00299DD182|nr:Abi family protein [Mycolicibacterium sp. 120266]MDX1874058.1 Abi family protein [Mycolicibacterium sp. 120266]